jgi:hypothetical protein
MDRMIRALAVLGKTPEDIARLLALEVEEIDLGFNGELWRLYACAVIGSVGGASPVSACQSAAFRMVTKQRDDTDFSHTSMP